MSQCVLKDKSGKHKPFWFESDQKANKKGLHNTVYFVNGDEYIGEWDNNMKHGRGTMTWKSKGLVYEGDWQNNEKNGFGVLSVKTGKELYKKIYSGGWKNNKRHGFGENWYSENEFYEGEWYEDKRCGWGRMYFADGTVYEGEWDNDSMSGQGMIRNKGGNRYEGEWKNGMRNGRGKYYYLDKGQVLEGIWVNNVSKCGEITEISRDTATNPSEYPMAPIGLVNPLKVLKETEAHFLSQI